MPGFIQDAPHRPGNCGAVEEVPEDMARTEDIRRSLNDCLRVFFGGVRRKKNSLSQMDKALNPCAHRPICFETYTDLDHSLPLDCDLSNNLLNVDIHGFQQRKLVASTLAGDQVTLIH